MTKYAQYDSTASQPAPVIGWYDTDAIDYPALPDPTNLIEINPADWAHRFDTPYVDNGKLVPAPEPTAAERLAIGQQSKIVELQAGYAATISGGATSDALGSPHVYPVDDQARSDLNAVVTASLVNINKTGWTAPFACVAPGNEDSDDWPLVPHTAAQIQHAGDDVMTWYIAQRVQLKTLVAQTKAATAQAAVDAIAWSEATP